MSHYSRGKGITVSFRTSEITQKQWNVTQIIKKSNAQSLSHLLCTSLSTDVQIASKSHYGKPRKPVHLKNVHCTGREQHILSCTLKEFNSLEEKKAILNEVEVAGVLCQPQSNTENPTTEDPTTDNPTRDNPANNSTPGVSCSQTSSASVLVPTILCVLLLIVVIALIILWVAAWLFTYTFCAN